LYQRVRKADTRSGLFFSGGLVLPPYLDIALQIEFNYGFFFLGRRGGFFPPYRSFSHPRRLRSSLKSCLSSVLMEDSCAIFRRLSSFFSLGEPRLRLSPLFWWWLRLHRQRTPILVFLLALEFSNLAPADRSICSQTLTQYLFFCAINCSSPSPQPPHTVRSKRPSRKKGLPLSLQSSGAPLDPSSSPFRLELSRDPTLIDDSLIKSIPTFPRIRVSPPLSL